MKKKPAKRREPKLITVSERKFLRLLASALSQTYRIDAERHLFERQDICDAARAVVDEESRQRKEAR